MCLEGPTFRCESDSCLVEIVVSHAGRAGRPQALSKTKVDVGNSQ